MIANLDRSGNWTLQERLQADRDAAVRLHAMIIDDQIELIVPGHLVLVVILTLCTPANLEGMPIELRQWIDWHVNRFPGLDPIDRDRFRKWCSVPLPAPVS